MWKIGSEKRFYYLATIALVAIFVITLVQNVIRYSDHSSYSIWVSIGYLCVSVLLFVPFLMLGVRIQKTIQKRYPKIYWVLIVCSVPVILFVFYLLSNVVLHSFGYFDHFIDQEYARYYFGREALYHLLLIIAAAIYVHNTKEKKRTILVSKGRKTVTLPLASVLWVEADDHYLKFHTETDTFIKRYSMGAIAKQLSPDFIRIHRKYLVNKEHIHSKEKQQRDAYLVLNSGKRLKIGQSYKPVSW